jgi:hypothetical protein
METLLLLVLTHTLSVIVGGVAAYVWRGKIKKELK